jgi:carbamoyl-phosphate synthase large subunit
VLFVIEANPRASRTVPFVSKATGVPLAGAASRIMLGATIAGLRAEGVLPAVGDGADLPRGHPVAVKEAVLPFHRFRRPDGRGVDSLLGPEMKSTGEVMGIDSAFSTAFAKAQAAASGPLPTHGRVFVSVANRDKRSLIFPVKRLADLGFSLLATAGTASVLERNGIPCEVVRKHFEGPDNIVDKIAAGEVDLVVNTPVGHSGPRIDGYEIRAACLDVGVPCVTTVQGAAAAVQAIEAAMRDEVVVTPLQTFHARLAAARALGTEASRAPEPVAVAGS